MSIFTSQYNVISGKEEWCLMPEDYDLRQEIARSAYGDMLHDKDRNVKYYDALRKVIANLRSNNKFVHVLDIGTGTGLLSMMAVKSGADKVTACEAFTPMAQCAQNVIQSNGFSNQIKLIPKRSDEITVGEDMDSRANVLVAELFDTELIGEGALPSFFHAAKNLLTNDAIVIPSRARLYIQAIQSDFLRSHFTLLPKLTNDDANAIISIPLEIFHCRGCPSVYDLQASELRPFDNFIPITKPALVKTFSFFPASDIVMKDQIEVTLPVTHAGQVDAFIVWWDLDMDPEGSIVLTCAPKWHNPTEYHWRDHWMQGAYFPRYTRAFETGQTMQVGVQHDDYSMWMDWLEEETKEELNKPPICTCHLHMCTSRQRMLTLNTKEYHQFLQNVSQSLTSLAKSRSNNSISSSSLPPLTRCLTMGSFGFLPLYLSQSGFVVDYLASTERDEKLMRQFAEVNGIGNQQLRICSSADPLDLAKAILKDCHAVVVEPYIAAATLDWLNLNFVYILRQQVNRESLDRNLIVSPMQLTVYCLPMELEHLHKLRAPVCSAEEFQLHLFDEIVNENCHKVDAVVEPHPLWEYPGVALGPAQQVLQLNLKEICFHENVEESMKFATDVQLTQAGGQLNAIAFWCEWEHLNGLRWSSGLVEDCVPGTSPKWRPSVMQGVTFIPSTNVVANQVGKKVQVFAEFNVNNANFTFHVDV